MTRWRPRRRKPASSFRVGVALYVGAAVLLALLAAKPTLTGMFAGGEEVTAEFPTSNKLIKYKSAVKVAGLEVGQVSRLEYTERDTVIVHMVVDSDALETLGSAPSARIEPRNVLGGRYTVDLVGGGDPDEGFDGRIPIERTAVTTEIDEVLEDALPASAREGLQGLANKGTPTLRSSQDSLAALLRAFPPVANPAADVFEAVQGNDAPRDLPAVITNLHRSTKVLSQESQLEAISDDMDITAGVLARRTPELSRVLDDLPETLQVTSDGLEALDGTVDRLRGAARDLRPTAPGLVRLLSELTPTLREAQPLLRDLQPMLRETEPAVRDLVPVADDATKVLDDLHGPVLDRLNGPIATFILEPWHGTGPFAGGGAGYLSGHRFYEELGYLTTNLNRASMSQDRYGSMLAFQAGAGLDTALEGLPFSVEGIVRLALREQGVRAPAIINRALRQAGVHR